jgi:hypothetical protein
MIGESATMARQIVDMPPWRIGSATGENASLRLKLARIKLPAWLWMSTAVPSAACAITGTGRQKSGTRGHQGAARDAPLRLGAAKLVAPTIGIG